MSRFILFSAALHVGVLAALSLSAARPPLFPATLSVALSTAPNGTPSPLHHRDASVQRENAVHAKAHTARPEPLPSPRNMSQSGPAHRLPQEIQAENEQADLITPRTDSQPARVTAVANQDEALTELNQQPDPQAQQSNTTRLASQLQSQLRDALAPYFTYPLMARRNGWQGQVQVGVRVEADGSLSHLRIAHSSGYRTLDSAALTTLNHIDTLPEARGWLEGRYFDMVLPIEYRLVGG